MEIEKKFLVKALPSNLSEFPHFVIEQAYICTNPVLRIRKKEDSYIFTYKGEGLLAREEHEFPLTKEAYSHLRRKADGNIITKTRYLIPEQNGLTIELDIFSGCFTGLTMAEIEFPDIESAQAYSMPDWFLSEVTEDIHFQNASLSEMSEDERITFLRSLS